MRLSIGFAKIIKLFLHTLNHQKGKTHHHNVTNHKSNCPIKNHSRPIALVLSGAVVPVGDGSQDTADELILNLLMLLHGYLSLLVCIYILSHHSGNCKLECCTKNIAKKILLLCTLPKFREVRVVGGGHPHTYTQLNDNNINTLIF